MDADCGFTPYANGYCSKQKVSAQGSRPLRVELVDELRERHERSCSKPSVIIHACPGPGRPEGRKVAYCDYADKCAVKYVDDDWWVD